LSSKILTLNLKAYDSNAGKAPTALDKVISTVNLSAEVDAEAVGVGSSTTASEGMVGEEKTSTTSTRISRGTAQAVSGARKGNSSSVAREGGVRARGSRRSSNSSRARASSALVSIPVTIAEEDAVEDSNESEGDQEED